MIQFPEIKRENAVAREDTAAIVALLLVFGTSILAILNIINNFTVLLLLCGVAFFVVKALLQRRKKPYKDIPAKRKKEVI